MKRSLTVIQRNHAGIYTRVSQSMNDGSTTPQGSWSQRNAALYSVVCDTLDLSKTGRDLDFLEVVDEGNGLALYNLARFRLREIKSSDPLARAIKLQMGLHHIKYVPKPHGVAQYFARIDAHRSELASLPRPKIIDDWEVTAKALRELPSLHPLFKSAADILKVQRQILKTETTLEECRNAFVSADVDNDIGGDLHAKHQLKGKAKRKIRANASYLDKRARSERDDTQKPRKYNHGDCVHHPKTNTHLTSQCTNPFGIRSAFGFAVSYDEKCAAVKASVAAGWSPKATNVKIPQGYGCDGIQPSHSTRAYASSSARSIQNNNATITATGKDIRLSELRTYHKVRELMEPARHVPQNLSAPSYGSGQLPPRSGHVHFPPARPPHYQPARGSPVRAYHAAPAFNSPPQPPVPHELMLPHHRQPVYPARPPFRPPLLPTGVHTPAPMQANAASFASNHFPQPSQEDLIAAGMRYYATQTGMQDFQ